MTKEELLELKSEIEEAEKENTKLEARKDLLMEKLEKDHGVKTLAAAQKKITKLEKEIETLDQSIDTATEALEARLNETD